MAVMEVCRKENAAATEVARVLRTDPAMSGRLIKLANAAAYAGRPVASVQDAVLRLGFSTVRQLALGFSLLDDNREGPCKGFDYQAYWSRSLLMAIVVQELGAHCRAGSPDELFACGLLAQVGRLALASVYPEECAEVLEKHRQDPSIPLTELEREALGADHNELTAALLQDWGIPDVYVQAVFHHEALETASFEEGSRGYSLVHLLHLAGRLADLGFVAEHERHRLVPGLLLLAGKAGLDAEELGGLTDRAMRDWQEWGKLLDVQSSSLPSFADISRAESQGSMPGEDSDAGETAFPMRILVVDDNVSVRLVLETILRRAGHTVYAANHGREALELAVKELPQTVITDWMMPEMDGVALTRALRETEQGRRMYILMLTGQEDMDRLVEAFDAGVDDYVVKPFTPRFLIARLRAAQRVVRLEQEWERERVELRHFAAELAVANRRLQQAALNDVLTGLPNRRSAMERLDQSWSAASRSGRPLSVMVIDIDAFKKINDTYGHAAGDAALKATAETLRLFARKQDAVCRMGGEEFLVVCQDADLKAALQSAERLRGAVAANTVEAEGAQIRLTISVGVACREEACTDVDALVRSADQATYAAKNAGRNRICIYTRGKVFCGGK